MEKQVARVEQSVELGVAGRKRKRNLEKLCLWDDNRKEAMKKMMGGLDLTRRARSRATLA
jgi:hypothetical protein